MNHAFLLSLFVSPVTVMSRHQPGSRSCRPLLVLLLAHCWPDIPGPWGAPRPRWPRRLSLNMASPQGHPTRGPLRWPAGVGVAPGPQCGLEP